MKLNSKQKKELLLRRGFTEEEINSDFEEYRDGQKKWLIRAITIDEVLNSDDSDVLDRLLFSGRSGRIMKRISIVYPGMISGNPIHMITRKTGNIMNLKGSVSGKKR